MPWSEAFERQKTGTYTSSMLQKAGKRDLSPKKMSDSYHKVVCLLQSCSVRSGFPATAS